MPFALEEVRQMTTGETDDKQNDYIIIHMLNGLIELCPWYLGTWWTKWLILPRFNEVLTEEIDIWYGY